LSGTEVRRHFGRRRKSKATVRVRQVFDYSVIFGFYLLCLRSPRQKGQRCPRSLQAELVSENGSARSPVFLSFIIGSVANRDSAFLFQIPNDGIHRID
jgi:hypothetical protein